MANEVRRFRNLGRKAADGRKIGNQVAIRLAVSKEKFG